MNLEIGLAVAIHVARQYVMGEAQVARLVERLCEALLCRKRILAATEARGGVGKFEGGWDTDRGSRLWLYAVRGPGRGY